MMCLDSAMLEQDGGGRGGLRITTGLKMRSFSPDIGIAWPTTGQSISPQRPHQVSESW